MTKSSEAEAAMNSSVQANCRQAPVVPAGQSELSAFLDLDSALACRAVFREMALGSKRLELVSDPEIAGIPHCTKEFRPAPVYTKWADRLQADRWDNRPGTRPDHSSKHTLSPVWRCNRPQGHEASVKQKFS
jgi:hypothetical protein